ncbi:Glycine/D-amino acid oxidase [Catalinimonas alkaloidigena]|uniref:D-amino-acid oxidase n=1 Tax=Catalinimonas alkaloidigena TaxID=1075417 RepID=A0A1G9UH32_9BACT|nr:FAD-dependent oxidoreductase [Catalinimonas alkaloidigena]SDM59231.1 Glycine/D-amino acid oxidase [Catalinimonas alkaloidigena]
MDRRHFIAASGLAGLGLMSGLSSCAPAPSGTIPYASRGGMRRLPKLRVSSDRIIKETVGLRPYRLSGPRVETEMLGNKTIVHHYGHGGSGWSLSWGTAHHAADLVQLTGEKKIAVMGCGVIGLTTARTLQSRGYDVTIYTKDLPPDITSSKATGTWSPTYRLCETERITPEFSAFWEKAATYSFRAHQNMLGRGGVTNWVEHYTIHDPAAAQRHDGHVSTLHLPHELPEPTVLKRRENPFRAEYVSRQTVLVFQIPAYLDRLMNDFVDYGGTLRIKSFDRLEEVDALPEACVVNCTGIGAKALFNDAELMPIAGQLSFLVPQPEVNYRLSTPNGYFIPRNDGIILGGNAIVDSWDTTPSLEQTQKVVAALQEAIDLMRG